MQTFRIPESYIASINKRRTIFVFFASNILILVFDVWRNGSLSLEMVGIALLISFLLALGRGKYPWVFNLQEEAEWELLPAKTSLEFHKNGYVSEINGKDITKIRIKYHNKQLIWFDIDYLNQTTRIRHYPRIQELLAHVRKIACVNAVVQNIY